MDDIIDRLRDYSPYNLDHIVHHGANEIKRLRAENLDLRKEVAHQTDMACQADVACIGLRAQVAQLERDAARWRGIARMFKLVSGPFYTSSDQYVIRGIPNLYGEFKTVGTAVDAMLRASPEQSAGQGAERGS